MPRIHLLILLCTLYIWNGNTENSTDDASDVIMSVFNLSIFDLAEAAKNFKFKVISDVAVSLLIYQNDSDSFTELYPNSLTNDSKTIIVIVHGFLNNGKFPWIKGLAKAYNEVSSDNYVVSVDWKLAWADYITSASSTQAVGFRIAELLYDQVGKNAKRLKSIHMLGHSLGAHVAGFASNKLQQLTGKKAGRITGLEPAGPLFTYPIKRSVKYRLDKRDADFVDALHTNINRAGQKEPAGDVDVYLNCGGPVQPVCQRNLPLFIIPSTCSHLWVTEYFTHTIRVPNAYPAQNCYWNDGDVIFAGEGVSRDKPGIYCSSTEFNKGQQCDLNV